MVGARGNNIIKLCCGYSTIKRSVRHNRKVIKSLLHIAQMFSDGVYILIAAS